MRIIAVDPGSLRVGACLMTDDLSRAQTLFGTGAVVRSEMATFSVTTNQINTFMDIFIPGSGGPYLEWDRAVSYRLEPNLTLRQRYSGGFHEYRGFTAGPTIMATTTTSVLVQGVPPINSVGVVAGVFGAGEQAPSTEDFTASVSSGGNVFFTPGAPPLPAKVVESKNQEPFWTALGTQVSSTTEYWGSDQEVSSDKFKATRATFTTEWIWGNIALDKIVGGGASGSSSEPPGLTARSINQGASGPASASVSQFEADSFSNDGFSLRSGGSEPPGLVARGDNWIGTGRRSRLGE